MAEAVSDNLAVLARPVGRRGGSWWKRVRLLGEVLYGQIERDDLLTQAAALTYTTLFSLLPILVLSMLVLSMLSAAGGNNALEATLKGVLFEQLNLDRMPLTDDGNRPLLNAEGQPVTLAHYAEHMIEVAKNSVSGKATGLVAFGILLYGALSLMIVIESTFNRIYRAAKARSWSRRIGLYWCVLTLGPIGVAASIVLGQVALNKAAHLPGATWVYSAVTIVSGFAVSWGLVLLLYRLIPEARVRWRPAAVGALVVAVAWEVGKWGFGLYTQWSLRASWYGSLALLPLFMLWLYMMWIVVLAGLELAYVQQNWKMLRRRQMFARAYAGLGARLSDLRWVLPLGVLLCRRFATGKTVTTDDAAEELVVPNETANDLLLALEKAGVVRRASEGFALARPAEAITAADLLAAARAACEAPVELATGATGHGKLAGVRELAELEERWAKSKTLRELAGE